MESDPLDTAATLTLIAIVTGPILAVVITRWFDARREKTSRRLTVFRDLMRTRATRIDPIHVGALNLVELEFYKDARVRDAYSNHIRHLNSSSPNEIEAFHRHWRESDDLFWALMSEMANALGMKFDKADLERRSYQPEGLGRFNADQMANTRLLREMLEGRRPLPVVNGMTAGGLYPPPPERQQN